jgi:hypothetical protein
VVNRVQVLLRRVRIDAASGTQAIEDAACLAFMETQVSDVAARLEREQMIQVLRRTAAKMSPAALDLVGEIPLDPDAAELLAAAVAGG